MKKAALLTIVTVFLLLFSACLGGKEENSPALNPVEGEEQQEAAQPQKGDDPSQGDENTEESNSLTTLVELSKSREKINSYAYTVEIEDSFSGETIVMNVWFMENKMKVSLTQSEMGNSISYYDLNKGEFVSYFEEENPQALKMTFTPGSENAPDNPLEKDILSDFEIIDRETIDGYNCTVLQNSAGDIKLWLMNRYGFPVKMATVDAESGEEYFIYYKNIVFNNVSYEDVNPPAGLEIVDFTY